MPQIKRQKRLLPYIVHSHIPERRRSAVANVVIFFVMAKKINKKMIVYRFYILLFRRYIGRIGLKLRRKCHEIKLMAEHEIRHDGTFE